MPSLPDYKTILYASDLGKKTRPVFRTALSMARKYDAQIIMIHVVEPMSQAMRTVVDTYLDHDAAKNVYQDGMREVLATMKRRLARFCEEEMDSHNLGSINVKEVLVVSGKTSEEILKAAEKYKVDLVIVGKSTRVILGNDVAGSTARRVSRYANIPVMIVPNQ
ncbi:MAG: universal stress protein UspA [Proteobacteria bacterium]|nr:MAG: universal stress protein UspA [Pseudomonadota bacterium]